MRPIGIAVATLWGSLLMLFAGGVAGQAYPTKPIHIFVAEPGGGTDLAGRLIGQAISGRLGQPVIIENRPPFITTETAAKAQPDGYTLLLNGPIVWLQPLLQSNVPWDSVRDFAPITLVSSACLILVVHPSLPVKSVTELVALAKANPGTLNYSTAGSGVPAHFAAELFKAMAGVKIVQVNYKGTAAALNGVIAGEIHLMFGNAVPVAAGNKAGKLRALAVTSARPSTLFPGLPTVAASGLPGYETEIMLGIFSPSKTPEAIVTRLNQEIVRALNDSTVKEKFLSSGVEAVSSSPEQLAAAVKADTIRIGKIIKDQGIRID